MKKSLEREGRRDKLLEQVTETTYQRTKRVKRGNSTYDYDSSDSDLPQVEWPKVTPSKRKDKEQSTSTRTESRKLMFF